MNYLAQLMDLDGRRALVTGAAGGLGRIIAETIAELGGDLALVDLPSTDMSVLAAQLTNEHGISVSLHAVDLESESERATLAREVLDAGGIDVLVNNAAFVGTSNLAGWAETFDKQSLEAWRRAIEVNLTAAFHLSQLFAPSLGSKDKEVAGSIVNIASIYGQWGPDWSLYEGTNMSNPAAYGASKAGLIQLSQWLSTTLAPNVRVNSISPGGIARGQDPAFVERYENRTPMGRMATESDFRGAVAYLASDMSAYVTGQTLAVDGGWGAW